MTAPMRGRFFAQAHSINPRHAGAVHALGIALMDDHEFARAAEFYRSALAANPADTAARINLGGCLLDLGQADVAYACLRAATAAVRNIYGKALKVVGVVRPRTLLAAPSAAAKFFRGETILARRVWPSASARGNCRR